MFKLIPFTLIVLMISKKANYFDDEDEEVVSSVPYEFMKTMTFSQRLKKQLDEQEGVYLATFDEEIAESLKEKLGKDQAKYVVLLNKNEEEAWRSMVKPREIIKFLNEK
jgi:hypothetical protein